MVVNIWNTLVALPKCVLYQRTNGASTPSRPFRLIHFEPEPQPPLATTQATQSTASTTSPDLSPSLLSSTVGPRAPLLPCLCLCPCLCSSISRSERPHPTPFNALRIYHHLLSDLHYAFNFAPCTHMSNWNRKYRADHWPLTSQRRSILRRQYEH
jgi:hypothetical protein